MCDADGSSRAAPRYQRSKALIDQLRRYLNGDGNTTRDSQLSSSSVGSGR